MKRVHFIVTGRVQGVGFRYFCLEEAERYGLSGYARNLKDGSVEIEAEGDEKSLEAFAASVARGPRASKVDNVVREERRVTGDRGFTLA
jgi:acylphosphatase